MVMERSVLMPNRRRLLRGAVLNIAACTVALILAQYLLEPGGNVLGAALFACGAGACAASVARTLWMLIMRTPAFAADDAGFSVMGGRHRPWSQYRATRIERLPGMLPLSSVVIEFQTGPLIRFERVPAYALPEAAKKFAARIEALSAKKKWIADLAAEPIAPAEPAEPGPTLPRPAPNRPAMPAHLHSGPRATSGSGRLGGRG